MTTTYRQQLQRLCPSNSVKNLYTIINNSELNKNEKTEIYDLLKNITQEPKPEEMCVAVKIPECCICMEQIVCQEETTSCDHKFHINCIHKWCESNNSCPMCRQTNPIGLIEHDTTSTGNTSTGNTTTGNTTTGNTSTGNTTTGNTSTGNTGENINYYYNNNHINNDINNNIKYVINIIVIISILIIQLILLLILFI